jgi:hypothetical protein
VTSVFSVGGGEEELEGAASDQGLFAETGTASEAPLSRPEGLLLDERDRDGDGVLEHRFLFVADTGNGLVRRVDLAKGTIESVAGSLAASDPPSTVDQPATAVRLRRPTGLALDPELEELFIADVEARQVLVVALGPGTIRAIATAEVARAAKLAFHRFPARPIDQGRRFLFLLDLGEENSTAGASVLPPRLHTLNLDDCSGGACFTHFLDVEFGPGFTYRGFRALADLVLERVAGGGARLFVAADVGEEFESIASADGVPTSAELGFELDCHDGRDDDGDGTVDSADDDCREPAQVQVLRFDFQPDGTSGGASLLDTVRGFPVVTGFRRFPVDEVVLEPPDCPGCNDGGQNICGEPSLPVDFPELVVSALALDGSGALYVLDPIRQEVSRVDRANARLVPLAGTGSELAEPFDGASPRATRLERPRAILVDHLLNLIVADTANNRVRRAWIGDL